MTSILRVAAHTFKCEVITQYFNILLDERQSRRAKCCVRPSVVARRRRRFQKQRRGCRRAREPILERRLGLESFGAMSMETLNSAARAAGFAMATVRRRLARGKVEAKPETETWRPSEAIVLHRTEGADAEDLCHRLGQGPLWPVRTPRAGLIADRRGLVLARSAGPCRVHARHGHVSSTGRGDPIQHARVVGSDPEVSLVGQLLSMAAADPLRQRPCRSERHGRVGSADPQPRRRGDVGKSTPQGRENSARSMIGPRMPGRSPRGSSPAGARDFRLSDQLLVAAAAAQGGKLGGQAGRADQAPAEYAEMPAVTAPAGLATP